MNQPIRVGERQRAEEHDIDRRKQRDVDGNTERQGEGGHRHQARTPAQGPEREPEIAQESVHGDRLTAGLHSTFQICTFQPGNIQPALRAGDSAEAPGTEPCVLTVATLSPIPASDEVQHRRTGGNGGTAGGTDGYALRH